MIEHFFGSKLASLGIDASFVRIQPDADGTNPNGGWGNLEHWLRNNPPQARINRYLRGLFDFGLDAKKCDAFLIQMDVDHVGHPSFSTRLHTEYGIAPVAIATKAQKVARTELALHTWSKLHECTQAETKLHVVVPAADSSESWCIAAFSNRKFDVEAKSGDEKIQLFMSALLKSEGRPVEVCAAMDKSEGRRAAYCKKHSRFFGRVYAKCEQFKTAADKLSALAS